MSCMHNTNYTTIWRDDSAKQNSISHCNAHKIANEIANVLLEFMFSLIQLHTRATFTTTMYTGMCDYRNSRSHFNNFRLRYCEVADLLLQLTWQI